MPSGAKQCWCYCCAGAVVERKTWVSHGRLDRPLRPVVPPALAPYPVLSMPVEEQKVEVVVDAIAPDLGNGRDHDDYDVDPYDGWAHLECDDATEIGQGQLTPQEIVIFLLDWMHTNKETDTSATFVWRLCQMLVPTGVDLPTFHKVKGILRAVELNHLQRFRLSSLLSLSLALSLALSLSLSLSLLIARSISFPLALPRS